MGVRDVRGDGSIAYFESPGIAISGLYRSDNIEQPDQARLDASLPRRQRVVARFTLVIVLLNLTWRTVRYGMGFPIWGDEAFVAVNFLTRDFADLLRPLEHDQIAPLGFMWAELAVTRAIGLSEWALRLVPYLCGVLCMLLFWRLAVRLLDRRTALLAVAIFAAAYYPVRHAAEVKPYSGDLLVSLVLTWLGWAVAQRPRAARRWLALILAGCVGVWVSDPGAFVAGGIALALGWGLVRTPTPRALAWWATYGLLLALSFGAMVVLYGRPQASAAPWLTDIDMWTPAFPPIREPWRLPGWLLRTHTGNMLAYPIGGARGGSTPTFILVVMGCVALWRGRRVMLGLLLAPLLPTFIAAAMHRYPYGASARVSLYMAPAFCLLAGVGLMTLLKRGLPRRRAPAAIGVAYAVLLAIPIGGIVRDVVRPYKQLADELNRRTIRDLASAADPQDRWIVFNSLVNVPHAPNLYAWGGSAARFRFYLVRLAPVPIEWSPEPSTVSVGPSRRVRLIVYRDGTAAFPEAQLTAYRRGLSDRLGQAKQQVFRLGKVEAIEVYTFPPSR